MGKEHELLDAARSGKIEVVAKILDYKRNGPFPSFRRGPNINHQDINGYTPLHHACLNGHKEIAKLLLEHGAIADLGDVRGSAPLYLAAWAGHLGIVSLLLNQPTVRLNVNRQTSDNETALHCAAQHGHTDVLELLLEHDAEPAIRNNSFQTALDLAAQFGRLQAVALLLCTHPELLAPYRCEHDSLGNRIASKKHIFTHTCLHLASRNGHKRVVETLLAAGIDVNIMTHAGTALHEAALCGKQSVVGILLKAGINVLAVDGNGQTALDLLKDYPTHVTYGIVSLIKEYFDDNANDWNMKKSNNDSTSTLTEDVDWELDLSQKKSVSLVEHSRSNNDSIMRSPYEARSTRSLDRHAKLASQYVAMKPVPPDYVNNNYIFFSPRVNRKNYERTFIATDATETNSLPCIRERRVGQYEPMFVPEFLHTSNQVRTVGTNNNAAKSFMPLPPIPTPRARRDESAYVNVLEINETYQPAISPKITNSPIWTCDNNNNNNNKHSPTPEFPPPTVTEAENTILNYMQTNNNNKSKRSSLRLSIDVEQNLNAYLTIPSPVESRKSNISDCVEEFVSDVPFAGLFKGSTLNLANDNKESDAMESHLQRLRAPSLVRLSMNKQMPTYAENSNFDLNIDEFQHWEEINSILKSIDSEFVTEERTKPQHQTPPQQQSESKLEKSPKHAKQSLQMRDPVDLQLGTSKSEAVSTWCHASTTLIYGQILYTVYYLGSTVIKELHGTISTRKSIQKLKRDSSLEEEINDNLVKDCNKLTRILKENNEKKRLNVEIAISCAGVKFMEVENKSTISIHAIENINCVCQDNEDLRYFAYITMEKNLHYCHVFMVDNVELASEIIMTLGQAFEVAYQLAISQQQETAPCSY